MKSRCCAYSRHHTLTNCYDYKASRIKNQDDCVLKCIKKESQQIRNLTDEYSKMREKMMGKFGVRISNDTLYEEDPQILENLTIAPWFVPVFDKCERFKIEMRHQIELFPRFDLCKSKCSRAPCVLEQFTMTSVRQDNPPSSSGLAIFIVELPQNGELKVMYKPKVTLVEYVTLFGSVISLWFGVSAF